VDLVLYDTVYELFVAARKSTIMVNTFRLSVYVYVHVYTQWYLST